MEDNTDPIDDSVDRLQELVEFVAKSLVDDPDSVEVSTVDGDRTLVVELSVEPEDLGKVIGREGRTARAIRTLLAASSARQNRRVVLEILE
ncbi:MAG: KH domain-containing protein [Myxococcota bacterium]